MEQSSIYKAEHGGDEGAVPIAASDIAGFWHYLSGIAADAAGNLYLADPEPTKGGNYPNNPKVSSNTFLPAIYSLSAATTPDFQTAETLLEDWTTDTATEDSRTSSNNFIATVNGGNTGTGGTGAHKTRKRHSINDYSGIGSIALAKPNSNVLLYAARSATFFSQASPEVLIVPSPKALHAAIGTLDKPDGGIWYDPRSVSVSANQLYGGSDSVFIAEGTSVGGDGAVYWYNVASNANSHANYLAKITGDGQNEFGGNWQSGAYAGNAIGFPTVVAASTVMYNMIPRLYIALSMGGVVYYAKGSTMQPLGDGCDFAALATSSFTGHDIRAMVVDIFGNLYLAGLVQSSGAEMHVCRKAMASSPETFLGGQVIVLNSLKEPTGIAVTCQ